MTPVSFLSLLKDVYLCLNCENLGSWLWDVPIRQVTAITAQHD